MKRNRFRFFALLFGGLFLTLSLFRLYNLWDQPPGIWWTPQHLAVRLETVGDRLEIFVGSTPLQKAISEGRVSLGGKESSGLPVAESDVTVRLNNYDRVRASRVPAFIGFGAGAGAAAVLLLFGLFAPALMGSFTSGSGGLTDLHLLHET